MTYTTLKSTAAALALTTGAAFAGDVTNTLEYPAVDEVDQAEVVQTEDGFDVIATDDTETTNGVPEVAATQGEERSDVEIADSAYDTTNQEVETLENAQIGQSTMVPGSGVGFGTEDDDGMLSDNTLTVADLVGLNVIGANGEDVGEIDAIIKEGSEFAAVVGVGGFLGLGEHDVAVPLSEFAISPEQVLLSSWDERKLKAQPEMEASQYTELDDTMIVDIAS